MSDQSILSYNPHPGKHIVDELEELGMSQAELARALDIPRTRLSEIIRGRRGVSADTALRLAQSTYDQFSAFS